MKNNYLLIFQIFLVITFFLVLYVYVNIDIKSIILQNRENMETPTPETKIIEPKCPDLLLRKGNLLFLYNTKESYVNGINPIAFNNLDEYINYLEIQRQNGIRCPVLFLQEETNAQGQDVYRVRPSPFNQEPGGLYPPTGYMLGNEFGPMNEMNPIKILDATRENPPFNSGNYAGFDPQGLYQGVYTELDKIHDSTQWQSPDVNISDNPMDSNWGGVQYTNSQINSGKYDDNLVYPPKFNNNLLQIDERTNVKQPSV